MNADPFDRYHQYIKKWSQAALINSAASAKASVRYSKKSDQALRELESAGRSREILSLLNDCDPGVRFGVASDAMNFKIAPEVTMPVFQSLLNDPSVPLVIRMMTRDGIRFLGLDKKKVDNRSEF